MIMGSISRLRVLVPTRSAGTRTLGLALLMALLGPATLAAQPPADPPLAGRPAQFSNIVGRYTISAVATPTEVPVEEPITLRVTIKGTGPAKYEPSRKYLHLFPERWANDFYVEPVPAEDRAQPIQHTWEFVWRLRPKHRKIAAIDGIKLVYYEPNRNGGKYQTEYADEIPIKVTAPRPAPALPDNVPVRVLPPAFYELPSADAILAPAPAATAWPVWLIVVLLLAPPLATVGAVRSWQRLFPDRGRRHQQQRSGAARRALVALRSPDAEPAWIVFGRYLRERLDFPAVEPTPADVRRFVRRRGASRPMAEKLAAFLSDCDKARFAGPGHDGAAALRDEAGRLIHALEDDLCVP